MHPSYLLLDFTFANLSCFNVVGLVVVVVEIFVHGAVKATVTNAPQSQLNK